MSGARLDWTRAVRDDGGLSSGAKLVGFALATFMDRDGVCWPSVETLRAATSLSGRTVERRRNELLDGGYLIVVEHGGGRRRSNRYRAVFPPERASQGRGLGGKTPSSATRNPVIDDRKPRHRDGGTLQELVREGRLAAARTNGRAAVDRAETLLRNVAHELPDESAVRDVLDDFDLDDDDVERLVGLVSRFPEEREPRE
jgi:hypothetical protein